MLPAIEELDNFHKQHETKDWTDRFVVSKKGLAYAIVSFLYVMSSLITPYIYAWYLVFGREDSAWVEYMFESFFVFNLIFQFFVEFQREGKVEPVRDLKLTA